MNKKNYVFLTSDNDPNAFIIKITEGDFANVFVRITDLNDDNGEFDFEVPKGQEHLFQNKDFTDLLQEIVGDIIKQSVSYAWGEETKNYLAHLEEEIRKVFQPYNYVPEQGSSFIEMFAKKQYFITYEDDKLTAINLTNNKRYYFDNKEQLAFLKKELSGTGIILN